MVLPASHGISRVPWYSGTVFRESRVISFTGLSPSMVVLSRSVVCWVCLGDVGFRSNEAIIINGTHQTSESLATNQGTAIPGTYPAFWPLSPRGYLLDVPGADFSGIAQGSPFHITVTANSGQGIIPVGNYIGYRTDAPGAVTHICLLYTSPSPRDS